MLLGSYMHLFYASGNICIFSCVAFCYFFLFLYKSKLCCLNFLLLVPVNYTYTLPKWHGIFLQASSHNTVRAFWLDLSAFKFFLHAFSFNCETKSICSFLSVGLLFIKTIPFIPFFLLFW